MGAEREDGVRLAAPVHESQLTSSSNICSEFQVSVRSTIVCRLLSKYPDCHTITNCDWQRQSV